MHGIRIYIHDVGKQEKEVERVMTRRKSELCYPTERERKDEESTRRERCAASKAT
jgi:hypothetical protein